MCMLLLCGTEKVTLGNFTPLLLRTKLHQTRFYLLWGKSAHVAEEKFF